MRSMAYDTREADRLAALAARRTALRAIPAVAAVWVVLVVVWADVERVLRIGTLVAVAASVVLGARAAVTARTFVRRWLDDDARRPPPMWVTLVAVAGAVATLVGLANVAADISEDRRAVRSVVLATVFLAVTTTAALAHVAGGRGVAAALASPSDPSARPSAEPQPPSAAYGVPPGSASTVDGMAAPGGDAALAGGATGEAATAGGSTGEAAAAGASAGSQLGALRVLLRDVDAADAGSPAEVARAGVDVFRQVQPAEVVAAARSQVSLLRARRLDERALAQVVVLLGCPYDPTEHGGTYRRWLADLELALASDAPA